MNRPKRHLSDEREAAFPNLHKWERIIRPRGPTSKSAARRILNLAFTGDDRARMHDLAERNRRGQLSEEEEAELDHLCRVGALLSILKVRARRILKSRGRGE